MTAVSRASRPSRSFRTSVAALGAGAGLAALLLVAASVPSEAAVGGPVAPTPLGATASATPEVQPSATPQLLVLTAPAAGATGPAVARGEGKVAAGRPVTFLLRAEVSGMVSIGVASPQNAARLSVFLGESKSAATGTGIADGAIRWSSDLVAGEPLKIVVHTAGAEIPFRVEVTGGPGGF